MPLIIKQPYEFLKFCLINIPLVQSNSNTVSDFATQSLTSYALNICASTFHHSTAFSFAYIANYSWSLSFLLSGNVAVLFINIIFKHMDLVILNLTHSCLKNIVVWNTYVIKRIY